MGGPGLFEGLFRSDHPLAMGLASPTDIAPPAAVATPVTDPGISVALASCPIGQALTMVTTGRPGGFLLPARHPEPRISLSLVKRPLAVVLRELAERAGFGYVAEGDLHMLTTSRTAAFYRRFADLDLQPGTPTITLAAEQADLGDVLAAIARQVPVEVVCHQDLAATMTVRVREIPWRILFHGLAATAEAECSFATRTVFIAPRGHLKDLYLGR